MEGTWYRGRVLNIQPQKNFGFINSPQLVKNVYFKIDMLENHEKVNIQEMVECQLDPHGENEKSFRALAVRKVNDSFQQQPPQQTQQQQQQQPSTSRLFSNGSARAQVGRGEVLPPQVSSDSTWSTGGSLLSHFSSHTGGHADGGSDSFDIWSSPASSLSRTASNSGMNLPSSRPLIPQSTSPDNYFRFDVNINRFRQVPPPDAPRHYGVVRQSVILPPLAKFLSVEPNITGTIELHNEPGSYVTFTEQNIWRGWPELDVNDTVEFITTGGFNGPARAEYIRLLIPAPTERHRGHLIRFLKDKGIGYVKCKNFQQDVYFYFTELYTEDGRAIIPDGAEVEFQLARKGNHADNRPAAHRISLRLVPQRVEIAQGIVQIPLLPNPNGGSMIGGNIRIDLSDRSYFLPFQESDLVQPGAQLVIGANVVCQLCYNDLSPQPYIVNVGPPGSQLPSADSVIMQAKAAVASNLAEQSAQTTQSTTRSFGMSALSDALPGASAHQSGVVLLEHLPEYLTPTRNEQKGVIKVNGSDQLVYFDPRGIDPRGMLHFKPGLYQGDHVTFDLDHHGNLARHIRLTQPTPNSSTGIVINTPKDDKKFGYIKCNDQEKHVFFHSSVWPEAAAEVGTEVNFLIVYRGAEHNPNAVRIEIRPRGSVVVTDNGSISFIDPGMDEGIIMSASKQQYPFRPSEFHDPQSSLVLAVGDEVDFVLRRDVHVPRIVAVDVHRRQTQARRYQSKVVSAAHLNNEFDVRVAREPRAPINGSSGFAF